MFESYHEIQTKTNAALNHIDPALVVPTFVARTNFRLQRGQEVIYSVSFIFLFVSGRLNLTGTNVQKLWPGLSLNPGLDEMAFRNVKRYSLCLPKCKVHSSNSIKLNGAIVKLFERSWIKFFFFFKSYIQNEYELIVYS